ncbi:glycoside hydrolase family 28 protein [Parasegetibacter sp. NRK P23]|uniref:glycoside hydrolase family 28 protein n=1 Tax=Parasegetibacter sp. NRK P23 TaxID=2942999 RepID=UPI002043B2C0|nr:glycoside hydrolase family 28 protein [Parasegetibacter sp. NRK P23]MCM5527284.1 glycoside hydrolase family 28 protein [Parasegetibacter sp. NRK P23]
MMKHNFSAFLIAFAIFSSQQIVAQAFPMPKVKPPVFRKDTLDIRKFGAKPDGVTLNTKAIQDAITACNKKGGGVVLVPSGQFLTGPIELLSNVNLHLQKNAMLLFTSDFSQYKLVETNWEGLRAVRNQSPVSALKAINIAITGSGIIDGGGAAWRMVKREKQTESQWKRLVASGGVVSEDKKNWYPSEGSMLGNKNPSLGLWKEGMKPEDFLPVKDYLRPNLLVLNGCKNILLEGVVFQNSAAWCLHPIMSSNIIIRNLNVKNPWYAQNGDGIDLESCKDVLIENSIFDVGDDGICIKSGRDAQGRKRAMPTENVLIRNSVVYQAHGGFVIGSEMSGGARNIYVTNCAFIGTDIGLRFKTTRGRGGVVENIHIKNIHMSGIAGEAILFDMYYAAKDPVPLEGEKRELPKVEFKPVTEETPVFKNFFISDVVCNGAAKAIFIRGLPEMHISNINLSNMTLQAEKGIECSEATDIRFNNVKILSKHTSPVVDIVNSDRIFFNGLSTSAAPELLFRVGGDRVRQIEVSNTTAQDAKNKIEYEFGASPSQVKFK